jgi:hypothetical protein
MFNVVFVGKAHMMTEMILEEDKKFWEELIAYVSLILYGRHIKRKNQGRNRQQGNLINLLFLKRG